MDWSLFPSPFASGSIITLLTLYELYFTDFTIDPQNFLTTRTLGLAPVNTTITVKYRVGGGIESNAGADELNRVVSSVFDIGDSTLDAATIRETGNSFTVINPIPIQGGKDETPIEELRQLIPANFAAQARVVTVEDYIVRTLSMPSKFGSVFRAHARPSKNNSRAIELTVLSRNSLGHVVIASTNLKENLKKYLSKFRMLTDSVEILDGKVVNIGINFSVLTDPDFNKSEVISNCIEAMKEFFETDKWQVNQPINKTELNNLLWEIPGVLSVVDLDIVNKVGGSYSSSTYNIKGNTQNGIVYGNEMLFLKLNFLQTI